MSAPLEECGVQKVGREYVVVDHASADACRDAAGIESSYSSLAWAFAVAFLASFLVSTIAQLAARR